MSVGCMVIADRELPELTRRRYGYELLRVGDRVAHVRMDQYAHKLANRPPGGFVPMARLLADRAIAARHADARPVLVVFELANHEGEADVARRLANALSLPWPDGPLVPSLPYRP